jgi:ABC-type uncharacterized transport system auxiliary subunit
MTRPFFLLPIIPLLAGCLGTAPPVPRDHYYRLLVSSPVDMSGEGRIANVIRVEPLQADGLLRERPLLYSKSGGSHEVQQHNYHYWTDAPPHMMQNQLVTYLRKSNIARSVVTPDMRVRADHQVIGKVKRLERLLGGGPPRVFVELELALVRLSDNALLLVDNFAEEEPEAGNSVGSAIIALNKATGRVFRSFLSEAQRVSAPMAGDPIPPGATSKASANAP